jgi:hypothetical protein
MDSTSSPTLTSDQRDYYKFRAEQYERNRLSLRSVEWQSAFQLLAQYGVIALAYDQILRHRVTWPVWPWAIGATIGVFFLHWYFSWRMKERQDWAWAMQNLYTQKIREGMAIDEFETPKGVKDPKHKHWYAFAVHLAMHTVTAAALIAYILTIRP